LPTPTPTPTTDIIECVRFYVSRQFMPRGSTKIHFPEKANNNLRESIQFQKLISKVTVLPSSVHRQLPSVPRPPAHQSKQQQQATSNAERRREQRQREERGKP
jgi:hypothetical protein